MDRRNFLAAAAVASVSPLSRLEALGQPAPRQFFELRRCHLLRGAKQQHVLSASTSVSGKRGCLGRSRNGTASVGTRHRSPSSTILSS